MSRPLLQMRKASSPAATVPHRAEPARRRPAGPSVGEQLRARFGEDFDTAALASGLDCPIDTAQRLQEFWLPREPRPLREQTLLVFARTLGLDHDVLRELVGCAEADRGGAPCASRRPAEEAWPRAVHDEEERAAPVRTPSVIWRKRHIAPTA